MYGMRRNCESSCRTCSKYTKRCSAPTRNEKESDTLLCKTEALINVGYSYYYSRINEHTLQDFFVSVRQWFIKPVISSSRCEITPVPTLNAMRWFGSGYSIT